MNAAGAEVILAGRDGAALTSAAAEMPNPSITSELLELDVTREDAVADFFRCQRDSGRSVDIIVNNAGVIDRSSLLDSSGEGWRRVLDVNLSAAYTVSREAARGMVDRRFGRIIMIASILGLQGKRSAVAYTASKHGMVGLARALAAELGGSAITANAICPGYIKTDINVTLQRDPAYDAKVRSATPAGRWGLPGDVAQVAVFLASDAAAYVNGHALAVDGGMTATH